jgi:acetyl-CoA C-acetyltransferase
MPRPVDVWLAAGVRTPFAKVDGSLQGLDALELSVPVARHMAGLLRGGRPDFAVWGVVVPNLLYSNLAREVLMDAGIDPRTPAFSTVMACSTSMIGAIEAAGMLDGDTYNLALVGGVDSLSRIQFGLGQKLSDWLRKFQNARSLGQKVDHATHLHLKDVQLYIPAISNRTTNMSRTRSRWKAIATPLPPGRGASSTTS